VRTADDFNKFYASRDPWNAERASFRDRMYRRFLPEIVRGKRILELGCGEGYTTATLLSGAASVTGIDISDVAISRARARHIPYARFETGDFLHTAFTGFDVITALECIYYLDPSEQEAFFAKVAREHAGKLLLLSGPIIGSGQHRRYFTHSELMQTFARHAMELVHYYNLVIYRRDVSTSLLAAAARIAPAMLDALTESLIFQRCYKIRMM
jgi:SAM-dependent methyltransferase